MQSLKVADLKPHPKNSYFFDDMEGEKWRRLLESIKANGVRVPILVTQDMVIVSGHQRVRACKELGIQEIKGQIEHYDSEDDVIRDLIETNVRQRGSISDSEIKIGRRIDFLQEYYGIEHGNNQHTKRSGQNVASSKTQDDLAKELGISKRKLQRYKSLAELIPELQDAVDSGQITATTAMGFVKKLSPEEQRHLAEQIAGKSKVSGAEVQQYVDQIKAKDEEIERLRKAKSQRESELIMEKQELERKLSERAETREIVKEVEPPDYQKLKNTAADYQRVVNERQKVVDENLEMRQRLREMKTQTAEAKTQFKLEEDSEIFAVKVYEFIKYYGGYVYLFERINDLPENKRKNFINAIHSLNAMSQKMIENLGGYGIE